ncbi:MAG TPA: FAD-binding oxidoreductase [Methylomirabilota bacterium]
MAVSAPALHDALLDIVGAAHVLRDPGARAARAVDGVVPSAVVRPGSAEEIGRVLALATAEKLAVAPRGAGTSQGLGNPPRRLDLVLELGRLTAVRDYVPEDMVATVETGLTLGGLAAHLSAHRQMLALDPPGGESRSIGGVLATHASGPWRFRYGTGRDLLLGARFVQADGTITWGGAKVVKSVTGYDVPKLLVGSLGTLGVLVEATLRLHPMAPQSCSWQLGFRSAETARDLLAALLDSPLQPDRAALLDAGALRVAGLTADPIALLVSFSSVAEAVEAQGEALAGLAARHGGRRDRLPESVWSGLGPVVAGSILARAAFEPRRLLDWAERVWALAGRAGAEVTLLGQPAHGVLQLSMTSGDELRVAREMLLPLRQALEAEGGSLVIERVPTSLKSECECWGSISPEVLAIMNRIKSEFDSEGALNPGRFVGSL